MRNLWVVRILVVLVTVLTMGRVVTHEFTDWDDPTTIRQNPRLNPPTADGIAWYWSNPHMDLYVPVTYTVWGGVAEVALREAADARGNRLSPAVFHGASLLVHALTALAVFELIRTLLGHVAGAVIGAILFAVHPVQVESVAWASGMKDLLCGLFVAIALWQYVSYAKLARERAAGKGDPGDSMKVAGVYLLATLAFVLGMLSKPTAMVAPAMALAIDLLVVRRNVHAVARPILFWSGLSLVCAFVAKFVQPAHVVTPTELWWRPFIIGDAITFYLAKLVWPWELAPVYGRTPHAVRGTAWFWVAWVVPVAIIAALWAWRKKAQLLVAAAILFVAGVSPVLGLVTFDFQVYSTVSDHYLYPAMIGVALAVAWAVSRVNATRVGFIAGVILLAFAVRSFVQVPVWKDDETLWRHQLAAVPESWTGWAKLGDAVMERGDVAQAVEHYRESVKRHPSYSREPFARALLRLGRKQEAIDTIDEYLRIADQLPAPERRNYDRLVQLRAQIQ